MSEGGTAWQRLGQALDRGDVAAMRDAVRGLDAEGESILGQHLGAAQVEELRRSARRSRETQRRAFGGRVVVIHGIMGARLDVVEATGESDRVWLNFWRLFNGRLAELALDEEGRPRDRRKQVRVAGIFPEYLPLLLELDRRWKVRPFAFDWRLDVEDAATRLAQDIRLWAQGEPCHILAHSMGGLVARRMIAQFPEVWASMTDPEGRGRGGRLIQLGTPNRGSFAIPMVLTGAEPVVRKLALIDRRHSLAEVLPILATFPGSYQMMPAPGSGPDDRDRLYDVATWGNAPALGPLLERGRRFQQEMAVVIDPERTLYVAGYDRDTPYMVRVKGPGRFEYRITRNGDGRVPHDLGLLDGVRTLWLDEVHGDLPRNARFLAGVHDLLVTGNTVELEQSLPATRTRAPEGWLTELPEDDAEAELESLAKRAGGARSKKPRLGEADQQRVEALVVRGWIGGAAEPVREPGSDRPRSGPKRTGTRAPRQAELAVEVVCADVTKVEGDVYAVGHYVGVLPQFAEAALDRVVSPADADAESRVLHTLTQRGVLRGDLGDVDLYAWADGSGRQVAVAGMGHPGSFGRMELRKLAHNLTLVLTALPGVRTVCSVLIGSGAGNLPVRDAVEGLLLGAADILRRERPGGRIRTLKLVELDLVKARQIHDTVVRIAREPALAEVMKLKVRRAVTLHPSGRLHKGNALSLALAGLATATRARARSRRRNAVGAVLSPLAGGAPVRKNATAHLEALAAEAAGEGGLDELASRLEVVVRGTGSDGPGDPRLGWTSAGRPPTRFSCVRDGDQLQVAALSDTAVVSQRTLRFDLALFDELAEKATDPEADRAVDLGALIGRLLVPHEFAAHVRSGAAVVAELDRYTARLPWEMIALDERHDGTPEALATMIPFARQLRTAYSPAPTPPSPQNRGLRALVIGDPGDPREGDDLPGARREAVEIEQYLRSMGVEVDARIGAPSAPRRGRLRGYEPAGRLETLELLLSGRYDLVHYCGHGDFDPARPDRTGWVFEGGLLTAREIERIGRAPRLVIANACLSGRTSEQLARGGTTWRRGDETGLLPSLADEFFKRGVRDYIGTAWEVSDEGAILFATTLYGRLLAGEPPGTLGDGLLAARKVLYAKGDRYDALWAAYQHYGDSQQRLRRPDD